MPLFLAHLWRETENDPILRRAALAGLRKYEATKRPPQTQHGTVHAHFGTAKLLRIGAQKKPAGLPVVLIPSLVNSHHILDLTERTSLARFLAARGHDPWLVDWGHPDSGDKDLDIAGHIEQRLLPMLRSIGRPAVLVGYCLGGTIALASAQLMKAAAVATIATPWHFDRFPAADRDLIAGLWRDARPLCDRLGYVPMEVLQTGFWALDPARTIRKYANFSGLEEGSEASLAFMAVEDWANDGAPLTYAAARDLFERFYGANESGSEKWAVGGETISLTALECPGLSIRSTSDRIVPAAAAPDLRENHESALGHVGMIVSAKAPEQIWLRLSQWLSANGG